MTVILRSICVTYGLKYPVLSSFMIYHRVCNNCNMENVTRGAGTAYPSGKHAIFNEFMLLDL